MGRKRKEVMCDSCYWQDQCNSRRKCDDYTPIEDSEDISYYQAILQENAEFYRRLEKEFK